VRGHAKTEQGVVASPVVGLCNIGVFYGFSFVLRGEERGRRILAGPAAHPFTTVLALLRGHWAWRETQGLANLSLLPVFPLCLSCIISPHSSTPSIPILFFAHVLSEVETARYSRAPCNVTCQFCSLLLILPLHVRSRARVCDRYSERAFSERAGHGVGVSSAAR
jgi:hypothetical protein